MASTEQCRVSVTQNTAPSSCLAPAQEMSELMSAVTILATVQPDWGFKLELQTKVKRRLVTIVSYSRLSHMIIASSYQFHIYLLTVGSMSIKCTFNQEKVLVGAFSVITNLCVDLRLKH